MYKLYKLLNIPRYVYNINTLNINIILLTIIYFEHRAENPESIYVFFWYVFLGLIMSYFLSIEASFP